jgi:hypothetical protein
MSPGVSSAVFIFYLEYETEYDCDQVISTSYFVIRYIRSLE